MLALVHSMELIVNLKNNTYRESMTNKFITLTAPDIAGEYISNFEAGRPLSILAKI